MEFSRPDYWSGFPSPGDLPNPGIELRSPVLQADSLPSEPQGKPNQEESKNQTLHSFPLIKGQSPAPQPPLQGLSCHPEIFCLPLLAREVISKEVFPEAASDLLPLGSGALA